MTERTKKLMAIRALRDFGPRDLWHAQSRYDPARRRWAFLCARCRRTSHGPSRATTMCPHCSYFGERWT